MTIVSLAFTATAFDLRLCALVNFRADHRKNLPAVVVLFGLAEVFKLADGKMALGLPLSGYTWKYVTAAWATWETYRWRRGGAPA